jgi:hypothetical protein
MRWWVVLESTRGGLPPELDWWLRTLGDRRLRIRKSRFDYYELAIEVYELAASPRSI